MFVTGLADGAILYKALSDRIHPIGSLRNDVTYSDFYDYFNCLEVHILYTFSVCHSHFVMHTQNATFEIFDMRILLFFFIKHVSLDISLSGMDEYQRDYTRTHNQGRSQVNLGITILVNI